MLAQQELVHSASDIFSFIRVMRWEEWAHYSPPWTDLQVALTSDWCPFTLLARKELWVQTWITRSSRVCDQCARSLKYYLYILLHINLTCKFSVGDCILFKLLVNGKVIWSLSVSWYFEAPSASPDHLCGINSVPSSWRHERTAGADGSPYELILYSNGFRCAVSSVLNRNW